MPSASAPLGESGRWPSSLWPEPDGQANAGDVAVRVSAARFLAAGPDAARVDGRPLAGGAQRPGSPPPFGRLLLEKVPFFGLSAIFSAVASYAQSHGGAVVEALPLSLRLMNAVVVYAVYLGKTLIPVNLGGLLSASGLSSSAGRTCWLPACCCWRSRRLPCYCLRRRPYRVRRLVVVSGHAGAIDRLGADRRAADGRPLHLLPADRHLPGGDLARRGRNAGWVCRGRESFRR